MAYKALKHRADKLGEDFPLARIIGFIIGSLIFVSMQLSPAPDFVNNSEDAWKVLSVLLLMLTFWVFEVMPIPITALLPIVLFPVMDIMPIKKVTTYYGHYIVFLFLGGFMLALAMERWKLHLRIAIGILKLTGTRANGIIFGFMVATAFLSMWMSNTATTVMMLPIAASVLTLMLGNADLKSKELSMGQRYFATSLMLGIAYAANIGGIGTLIGTPPNAILAGFLAEKYGYQLDFAGWMVIGIPFVIVMLLICWAALTLLIYPNRLGKVSGADKVIKDEWKKLGKMERGEKTIALVFFGTACMWMFKRYLPFDISDSGIAITAAVLMFMIPVNLKKGEFLVTWEDTKHLPWGILLLFGGGLSIAGAMSNSGLVGMIGDSLSQATHLSLFSILLLSVFIVQILTQTMSNLALIAVFLPMIAPVAMDFGQDPLLFVIPCTLAASCAFMLPMSTPPNAIVFASGHIRITQMVTAGFIMNILSLVMIMVFSFFVVEWAFGITEGVIPDWALNPSAGATKP